VFALEIKIDSLILNRIQYDLIDGLARNLRDSLPNASFIGFTGTPIEKTDANTRAVFGDYISIYDIQRAVADKATVAIYYESRAAKLGLNQNDLPNIDQEFEAIIEGKKPKEERMGHANSSRSRIFRALRKSSSHHATSPVCRGGLTSWSFLRVFVDSAWTTRKW
jgi:type I site-specific restriction-modification system R (restriction) subunit